MARIRSFSVSFILRSRSAIIFSCFFIRIVVALVSTAMASMKIKVIGYPSNVKFTAKNGYVKKQLMDTTLKTAEKIPHA